ncbi:UvrD-helicase domain-containing protein [Acetobacter cibinongensis]|uniref:UvrD-like helicase ATP-binding domain-containing protein n=1 Tax=Acetobacter cibinongensis TaxID=146475 RepID=A0A1Z5YUD0_9PROT|nr:UvrD-helicase domain-containing protein [Acetobacter cibinongensis]OUJ02145.1 hypothetical protein HK14_06785 [Acetobacter cibinongensis]
MKAVIFTPNVFFRFSHFSISDVWFKNFHIPIDSNNIKRVIVDDMVYILEKELNSDDIPIIIINLKKDGIFWGDKSDSVVFDRIMTVARSVFTDAVSIPSGWRKHREGSVFSIQSTPQRLGWKSRLHFETRPKGNADLFVFSRTEETIDFRILDRHLDIYQEAKNSLAEAVLTPVEDINLHESHTGIVLTQRLPQGFVQGASLEKWYENKLTTEQRSFVGKPHDGPVRLRGAAGTGKTLSLVIKFIRDAIIFEKKEKIVKFGFLTHSFASVDLVNSIGESLDVTGLLFGQGKKVKLEVRTLYDLANKNLNFELDQLIPLSLDGREGRRLQAEIINTVLREINESKISSCQFKEISPDLKIKYEAVLDGSDKRFVSEIMNEFASVLDASGIRASEEKGDQYARGSIQRPSWLLDLPQEIDRRFMLEIHRRYRKHLGEMDTLSVDQMIADFNSFLDSNRWDRIREREGYDVLFVDELHLFTSIERQILHKLIKRTNDNEGRPKRPAIFMAYDLKQSPRDTFANYGGESNNLFSASTGLQNSELVSLQRVFRYTPQIADFLADLDATFPAIDMPGEWVPYSGEAKLSSGAKPELVVFNKDADLFGTVFKAAHKVARTIDGGGRRVAVLCASEELFDKYLKAAKVQFEGKIFPIENREPLTGLRHAGKRFIFSMPEYVAGLQFDTIFLIHVDNSEAPLDSDDGCRRRFISNIYLGSSRAEKALHISSSMTRGGKSEILDMALARGSLIQIEPEIR